MFARKRQSLRWTRVAVVGVTVALAATFIALGAMYLALVQLAKLTRWEPTLPLWRSAASPPAAGAYSPDPVEVPARSTHDSRDSLRASASSFEEPAIALVGPLPDPTTPCELPLRLSAVVFDPARPERSLAVLRRAEPDSAQVSVPGMRFGSHTLAEVLPLSVRFEADGHSCWMRMFSANAHDKIQIERANARAQRKATTKRVRPRRPEMESYAPTRALSPAELVRAVRKKADSYLLDPQLLQKALDRWDHVDATTRVAAVRRKGMPAVRIVSLRRPGLLISLGLRKGDVLRTLNGGALRHDQDLRGIVAMLGSGEPVTLALDRGGQPLALNYVAQKSGL